MICSQPEHEAIITAVCGDSCGVVWKITALTINQQQNQQWDGAMLLLCFIKLSHTLPACDKSIASHVSLRALCVGRLDHHCKCGTLLKM